MRKMKNKADFVQWRHLYHFVLQTWKELKKKRKKINKKKIGIGRQFLTENGT